MGTKYENMINRAIQVRLDKKVESFQGFSERAGITRSGFYRAMANDSHNWSMEILRKVCGALGVTEWRLLKEADKISDECRKVLKQYEETYNDLDNCPF